MIWLTDISRADGGAGRGLCPRSYGAPQSIFAKMIGADMPQTGGPS